MLTDDVPTYLRKAEAALTAERDRVQVCGCAQLECTLCPVGR
jgi:hypothetical protein